MNDCIEIIRFSINAIRYVVLGDNGKFFLSRKNIRDENISSREEISAAVTFAIQHAYDAGKAKKAEEIRRALDCSISIE